MFSKSLIEILEVFMKKERLTIEDRLFIEVLVREKFKLKDIAIQLNKAPSTISREIKRNRVPSNTSNGCSKLNRFPFVCRPCEYRSSCKKVKYYYNPVKAHEHYLFRLKNSRTGIDMDIDEVEYWDQILKDRIKLKNQSTLHLFNTIDFPKSLPTFYSYVKRGIFSSVNEEMLPRLYSFKPRKKKKDIRFIHNKSPIRIDRTFKDFEEFMISNPNSSVVEMDIVIGCASDKYAILTLFFKDSKLMLMYKIEKYKTYAVTSIFDELKSKLGIENFKKLFTVILTDNGWEFSKPRDIELDYSTGEKLVNIFYCDPYRSWQKGGLERNHEFIRYIIPKGITFDNLTDKNIIDMMNNINSTIRKSLNNKTPFQLFRAKFGNNSCKLLNLKHISANDVTLSYHVLK